MEKEVKQEGIEVDKVTFDVDGKPEGLDDEALDDAVGGLAIPNYYECDLSPNGGC